MTTDRPGLVRFHRGFYEVHLPVTEIHHANLESNPLTNSTVRCKTFIQRFESAPRLYILICCNSSGLKSRSFSWNDKIAEQLSGE